MVKMNKLEGRRLTNLLLATPGGTQMYLDAFLGKKLLIYCWGSWSPSREALGDLQKFYDTHRSSSFDVISIALDVQGPEHPMRYLTRAHAGFTSFIDAYALISRAWGIKAVPQTLLLDEAGRVILAQDQLTHAAFAEIEKRLTEKAVCGPVPSPLLDHAHAQSEICMQYTTNLLGRGRRDDAIQSLHRALELDPDNQIIWMQIVALTDPDKFYSGPIDLDWLKLNATLKK